MPILEMNTLSKRELLEIERICDGYEADLRLSASLPVDVQPYVRRANEAIQPLVLLELERIQTEWSTLSPNQRITDSTAIGIESAKAANNASQSYLQSQLSRRFRLIELLGQGSSGCVWKAFDQQLNRLVALKTPHTNLPAVSNLFLREARAASRLNHPNIVRILEVGQEQEICFLISELIEGDSLANLLAGSQLTTKESVDLLIEIAGAIEYAHSMGIVHRDLKPQNVLIANDGSIKIVDFGLAKDWNDTEATVTRTGAIVGTPAYMSPEQAKGGECKPQPSTDIYSIGVIFFQLLTGDVPFRGNHQIVLFQVLHSDPPAPIRLDRNLPFELNTLCLKCLEKAPTDRFQTAKEFKEELIRFRDGNPINSKPSSAWSITKKWLGRNRRLSVWIASTCLLLVASTAVASVAAIMVGRSWQSEREQRMAAQNSESRLKLAFESESSALADSIVLRKEAQETVRFLESMFHSSDPINVVLMGSGTSTAVSQNLSSLLENATRRLRTELNEHPLVQARLLDAIGNAYRASGDFDNAQTLLDQARELREIAAQNGLANQLFARDKMLNTFYQGWLEHDQSLWQKAEKRYRAVLDMVSSTNDPESRLFHADVLFQLGRLLMDFGRSNEATPFMQESLSIRKSLLPNDSTPVRAARIGMALSRNIEKSPIAVLDVLEAIGTDNDWATEVVRHYMAGIVNRNGKNFLQARKSYEAMLVHLRKVLPPKHPIALLALGDYAGLLYDIGDQRSLEPIAKDLIATGDAICPGHKKLIEAKLKFACERLLSSNFSEATKLYEEVMAQQISSGEFPEEAHYGLVRCLRSFKKPEEALIHAEALWGHRDGKTASQVAWCAYTYARALEESGRTEDAMRMDERALAEAVIELHFPTDPISLERLATIHAHNDELARAEKLLREAVAAERRDRPAMHPRVADRLSSLAEILFKQQKTDEAHKLLTESLAIRQESLPLDDARIEENISALRQPAR